LLLSTKNKALNIKQASSVTHSWWSSDLNIKQASSVTHCWWSSDLNIKQASSVTHCWWSSNYSQLTTRGPTSREILVVKIIAFFIITMFALLYAHLWKLLTWQHHFSKRERLSLYNWLSLATFYWSVCSKSGKWAVMYLCIYFASFYDFL
jgi:hypothetical protein